jgi:hypothetical protein
MARKKKSSIVQIISTKPKYKKYSEEEIHKMVEKTRKTGEVIYVKGNLAQLTTVCREILNKTKYDYFTFADWKGNGIAIFKSWEDYPFKKNNGLI